MEDEDLRGKERGRNQTLSYKQKPEPNRGHLLMFQVGQGTCSGWFVGPVTEPSITTPDTN